MVHAVFSTVVILTTAYTHGHLINDPIDANRLREWTVIFQILTDGDKDWGVTQLEVHVLTYTTLSWRLGRHKCTGKL